MKRSSAGRSIRATSAGGSVSSRLLQSENRLRREGSHRPAALYRFAGNHDPGSLPLRPAFRPAARLNPAVNEGPHDQIDRIIAAYSKPEAADLAVRIKDQLQSMGCDVVAERELAQATPQTLRAIVVLGGDGLMMRAATCTRYPALRHQFRKGRIPGDGRAPRLADAVTALLRPLYRSGEATLAATLVAAPTA